MTCQRQNARFTADYKTHTCATTRFTGYTTRPIKVGEEVFLDPGLRGLLLEGLLGSSKRVSGHLTVTKKDSSTCLTVYSAHITISNTITVDITSIYTRYSLPLLNPHTPTHINNIIVVNTVNHNRILHDSIHPHIPSHTLSLGRTSRHTTHTVSNNSRSPPVRTR